MANIRVKNALGNDVYLAATGAGTDDDPFVPTQAVTGPLTEAQLRGAAVLVQMAALPDTAAGDLAAILSALGGTLTVDGAVDVDQTAVINALGLLLSELQGKADLTDTQPVSLSDLPDTSAGDLAAIRAALASVAVTGPLTNAELRAAAVPMSAATVTLTTQAAAYATSGDNTVIAAPGSGQRIVVSSIVVQNESATATTVLLKDGATTKRRALLQNQGDGVSWTFAPGHEWRLGNNAALVLNLSGANSHGVTVDYRVEAA